MLMTVKKVCETAKISVRTLHHYDNIGLLKPSRISDSGYRLYDEDALEKLKTILIFKELDFPLKEIKEILNNKNFDKKAAVEQQIVLLKMRKERIEKIIALAEKIREEDDNMDFSAFDNKEIENYSKEAKEKWGKTEAFEEFETRNKNRGETENKFLAEEMMGIFKEIGKIKENSPESKEALALVEKLQKFITEHYYTCTDSILCGLGKMYIGDERFRENIDKAGGSGTAEFAAKAIEIYCSR